MAKDLEMTDAPKSESTDGKPKVIIKLSPAELLATGLFIYLFVSAHNGAVLFLILISNIHID